ncbi:MAG: hypothetical protein QOJ86_5505 [Bradyrhizobium sp.]|jgi:hypothetical protein|nr:hypothetical protein [Bradyrhizobium sp.]
MYFIRRAVAGVAQFVGLLLILFLTAYGGFYAWSYAKTIRFISDQALRAAAEMKRQGVGTEFLTPQNLDVIVQVSNWSEPSFWLAAGALLGFLISTALVGVIFLLAEIAHNTRRTVAFFERVNSKARNG